MTRSLVVMYLTAESGLQVRIPPITSQGRVFFFTPPPLGGPASGLEPEA